MYLSFTRDVIGPPTRNVTDAAIMLEAIAGSDPRDGESSNNSVPKYPFVSAANPVNARTSSAALLDSPSFFKLTPVFIRPSKKRDGRAPMKA